MGHVKKNLKKIFLRVNNMQNSGIVLIFFPVNIT